MPLHFILNKFYLFIFGLSAIVIAGCSSNSKIAKSGTPDEKYELAKIYYKKGSYERALPIFQELMGKFRESNKVEEIYYYIAYCFYGMGDFETAASHFYNFTESFYNSSKTEECFFMYCMCQYYASDPPYLDQSLTTRAIENFQLFLNLFPTSKYREEANQNIDNLRRKLKQKAFDNAMIYYKMEDYKAAIVTFTVCLETYPDIEEKEEIEFLIFKSAYKYASLSIREKQIERYTDAMKYYEEYVSNYPNSTSSFFKEAANLKDKISDNINKLNK
ncbi:MAG: outer membrane protein assembly factor BamD [Bacteroidia bacterium]|nr:outer membrane protein assembly factor BamD [Bacteroidia bacterium]MCO5253051.1 outer membrane protein assembly factor BamD [Bacteroidota bacterium]